MKKLNLAFFAIAACASSLYAMEGGEEMMIYSFAPVSFIPAASADAKAAPVERLVPSSIPGVKIVEVSRPEIIASRPADAVKVAEATSLPETAASQAAIQAGGTGTCGCEPTVPAATPVSKPRFSVLAGIKKGFHFLTSPIIAHPVLSAAIACGGFAYALKKGYIKQLLVRMGLKKDDRNEPLPIIYN